VSLTIDANVWVAAADPADSFHAESRAFLLAVAAASIPLHQPAFAVTEAACALARRLRDPVQGSRLARMLLASLPVTELPLDVAFLSRAESLGARQFLRAADALYAAAAEVTGSQLVTWDDELRDRVGALSPSEWMAGRGQP
jgi:predicted nucleic acid-binding protein